ncbi:MAG: hypothetical protein ACNA8W_24865 [Bradymonadaceae bacterium]
MSILNSKFDVVRGWPGETAFDETFLPNAAITADNPLTEGDIVSVQADGTVDRATSVDLEGAAVADLSTALATAPQLWLVVEGVGEHNYSSIQQKAVDGALSYMPWKVVCIKGAYTFETQHFVERAYEPGSAVAAVGGIIDLVTTDGTTAYQKYGEVVSYDAVGGVLTVAAIA